MNAHSETARDRQTRHNQERSDQEDKARQWRLALKVLFGAWVAWHLWLSLQRGDRPRIEGLDMKLTWTRCLTGGAFLWILIMHPVSLAWRGLRYLTRRRGPVKKAASSDAKPEEPLGFWEHMSWLVPCVGSIGLFSYYYVATAAVVTIAVLFITFPWALVAYVVRRSFPGGRNEMVIVGLLVFCAVGFLQSSVNRGFYVWKIRGRSVHFTIPAHTEQSSLDSMLDALDTLDTKVTLPHQKKPVR